MGRTVCVLATLSAVALLVASGGSARSTQVVQLVGTVGPDFTITVQDAQGNNVTKLDPGTYRIEVTDRSDFHNFHLQGPGVNETTQVEFAGTVTWNVTFTDGTYTFVCDVHPTSMRGTFTVGNPPTPPPTTPPSPPTVKPVTPASELLLTSGPGFTITLKTTAGKTVRSMKTGTYRVVVRDRGRIHDAHVIAPGYNRRTSPLTYTGTQTWRVKLGRAGTFRFLCDPHAANGMKGSAKIIR
jgi:plastocyanin